MFQPSWALLSHIFGRKPLILAALVFFTAGSIISGLAHNFTVMLVGRTIQGVGGGGVIALTEVIVTDLVPLRERGKWFGFISGVWALGSVTGPVIGGAFSQNVSWVRGADWPWIALWKCGADVYLLDSDGSFGSTCHSPASAFS